jgi:arylsulfatase A-like enzyme/cytochrome c-type biogenesis protein CcmH/NrfG
VRAFSILGLGLLVALTACAPKTGKLGKLDVPQGTPVVLISIDTLRADHLPMYGYKGVDTPALDSLRRDSVLYENAYTATPLTFPSHTSLLTGVLPAVHGVRDNVGYVLDSGKITRGELPFLPWLLKQRGYATGGAVSAYVLLGKNGLKTGFDFYQDGIEFQQNRGLGGLQRPGSETLRVSQDWLHQSSGKPFFFFFHIYEPHTPYQPPEPFASRYKLPYDGEIATADQIVGNLLAELKSLGAYDRALIVLLSDHGEGLGDHGEEEHGVLLYREAIHVPLLLKLPKSQRAGATAAAPVGLTDVAPSVLALLGLPRPKPLAETAALVAALDTAALDAAVPGPARRIYSETFYPRLHFGWSDLASLADARWHYIEGPSPELYDMTRDPAEARNLLASERRVYADLRKEMQGYDRQLAAPAAVDEETRKALMSLGYLASGAAASGPLPDPRSRIGALADLKVGFQHTSRREYKEAAEAFRKVLATNPQMVDAWEFLAISLQKQGQKDEALAAYREALRISHGSPHIAMAAASLYFDLGQLDEAAAHARMALATNASFAHGLLAQIALQRSHLDEAEKEARAAMDEKSLRVGPLVTLAEVQHARGDYNGGLETLRQAQAAYDQREAKDPDLLRGLSLVRGKCQADLGDAAGAEASFRKEIELFPENVRAYSSLAILYALTGRGPEISPILQRMVQANPTPVAYAEAVKTLRLLKDTGSATTLLRYALGRYPQSRELKELGRQG